MNHNNMYNIIGKLNALSPKEEPKGNLLKEIQHPAKKDVVSQLNDRYATFKQRLNESQQVDELSPKTLGSYAKKAKPDFLDMDKDGNKKEPFKKAVQDKKKAGQVDESYDSDDTDTFIKIDASNPPLDATGMDFYRQGGDLSLLVKFIESKLGIPHVMYFDDDELVFFEKTIATLKNTIGDMIQQASKFIASNPKYVKRAITHMGSTGKLKDEADMNEVSAPGQEDWIGDEGGKHPGEKTWPGKDLDDKAHKRLRGVGKAVDKLSGIPVDEGHDDYESSPVANAITRRIMHQRTDLLKHGPQAVMAAIDDVADWVGDVEEIGSSDVSAWVKQVERMLNENPPEAFGVGVDEGETIPTKTGLIHKGTYGSDYDEEGSDDDYDEHGNKKTKAAGRPKKDKAPERVTGKAWKHKDGRQTTEGWDDEEEEGDGDPLGFTHGANTNGTSLKGYIRASYDQLVQVFGEPDVGPDDRDQDKVTCIWELTFNDGTVATIYDWKEGETPMGTYEWHIGGRNNNASTMVQDAFHLMHEGETIPTKTGLIHKGTYGSDWEDPEGKDDTSSDEPRKSGRPKKDKAPERVTGKAWKHKDGRAVAESFKIDSIVEDTMSELDGILLTEKAVSQQQQKFMGMVHAMQTGHKVKGASSELKKVAKDMGKKDAKDFAGTKHKGLPKKVNESMEFECSDPGVKAICHRYGKECNDFTQSGTLDPDLYHALHDHYYDTMPSGVKRGSNTQEWVGNRFSQDIGMGQPATVEAESPVMDESGAFYPGRTVYWRGKAGHVDRVEGNKCFVHLKNGDMDVWPTRECDTEKQSFMSTLGNDIKDIGYGMKGFLTGGPEVRGELDELARLAGLGGRDKEIDECNYTAEGCHCPKHGLQECGSGGMFEAKKAKPDFLDVDKDGDKKEPFKKAVNDKKKVTESLRLQDIIDHSNYSYSRESGYTAKIFKDPEWNEYVVKYYKDGKVLPSATWSHTDDIEDAHGTAMAEIKFMASKSNHEHEIDEAKKAKPDFLDVDKDGDKKEPFKKAVKDKEEDDKLDEAMSELRRLSGMTKSTREHVAHAIPNMYAFEKTVTEEFANEPDEQYVDADTIVNQGGDLNRKKSQYSGKPRAGDNPMTGDDIQMEAKLARLYNSIKVANK